ncbi:unnamed protein product [Thlaspi arvense]|uniref:Hexosyltransferase n=1 Tax=Thlaspi arvense TaxID=13288 RepID=A0AAU9SCI6_THLAR|nr:unnamed protein product [Thlaspi arvense]
MPLFSHRLSTASSSSASATPSYYSKPSKSHKPNSSSSPASSRIHLVIIFFSLVSVFIGVAGTIFAITSSGGPTSVYRCGGSKDTSRVSGSRKLGGDGGNGGVLPERRKLLGFVGIQTSFDSTDRRAALRSTWFPSDPDALLRLEQATGLAFRFVTGRSKDAEKMSELEKEIEKYRDFVLLDVKEEYLRLPYKTYEKQGNLIGNEYFLHAYGPIYVLSTEIVASLAAARDGSLRMFNNEDVSIGSWMLAMNVYHEDNRALCDPRCSQKSIAVWDIPKCSGLCNPEVRLMELHKMEMCSKSPTLPSDDIDQ